MFLILMLILRNILSFLFLVFAILVLFLPMALTRIVSGSARPMYAMARPVLRSFFRLVGLRIEIAGKENIPRAPFLLVCNHLSLIDGPLLVGIMPIDLHVLIKAETRRYPLVGLIFRLGDFVFVDRQSERRSAEALLRAVAQIKKEKHAFLIFPEGTRSLSGRRLPFKKGGFMIAIRSGIPILPARISGTYECMPPRTILIRKGLVKVRFCPPLDPLSVEPPGAENLCRHIEDAYYGDMEREEQST